MRDLTRWPMEYVGAKNVKVLGSQTSRNFSLLSWGELTLTVDRYQKKGYYHATVTLAAKEDEILFEEVTGERGSMPKRDFKADELVFCACQAALRYRTRKVKKPTPNDILEL